MRGITYYNALVALNNFEESGIFPKSEHVERIQRQLSDLSNELMGDIDKAQNDLDEIYTFEIALAKKYD